MPKLSIKDLDLKGKRVFVRVDFNVPIKDGKVAFDSPAAVQALKFWQDSIQHKVAPRKALGDGGGDVVSNLGSGAAAPLLPGLDGKLVLSSAGSSAVTVDLTMTSASGRRVGRRTVDVQRGQTRAVDLGGKRAAAVSLRGSGRGPLLAAVQWSKADSGGTLSSGFPLMPLRATILRPPVTYDLTDR